MAYNIVIQSKLLGRLLFFSLCAAVLYVIYCGKEQIHKSSLLIFSMLHKIAPTGILNVYLIEYSDNRPATQDVIVD